MTSSADGGLAPDVAIGMRLSSPNNELTGRGVSKTVVTRGI
jgi:hypothetical protein